MSAILSADDLNDFISPGVACIKPVEVHNKPNRFKSNNSNDLEIEIDNEGHVLEVTKESGATSRLQEAQISLADCLACSGCITSAEEVLVAQHSHKELLNAMNANKESEDKKVFVMSISHQSRASLAGALKLDVEKIDRLLIHLFTQVYGFAKVVGTGLGRKISIEHITEDLIKENEERHNGKLQDGQGGPKLTSVCPGWVLYAEKTHPYILPRINNVKSPQQITGFILKKLTAAECQISESQVYHLSIMPCFDKKLEAARPEQGPGYDDHTGEETSTSNSDQSKDVDCVITPKELIQMIQEENVDLDTLIKQVDQDTTLIDTLYANYAPQNSYDAKVSWLNEEGSSSGGYALQYLAHLRDKLYEQGKYQKDELNLELVKGRNSDVYVMKLVHMHMGTNTVVGSAAVVNGFRNIQNLVRKLKPEVGKRGGSGAGHGGSTRRVIGGRGGGLAARRKARELAKKKTNSTTETNTDTMSQQSTAAIEIADPSKCDFVEIMACPGGCINGGGQISAPTATSSTSSSSSSSSSSSMSASHLQKQWTQEIETLYNSIPSIKTNQTDLQKWVDQFLTDYQVDSNRLLRTRFNEVKKLEDDENNGAAAIALTSKW
ncbi:unnamed protein product [Ambrosiozyma monospora]|uniref:Cytosolic Fe-S cluster assembly factor NAR1 n=1 Tax=Ambrosiozyma monospora TaxID=43982 RepID=A0A9W7DEE7_AMBMO|nr:unnamed protein product [Ambrosiozyma monospora]